MTPTMLPLSPRSPLAWLGGLSPSQFMRRYWQKKPLLVRNAFPGWATGEAPPVSMQQVLQEARNDRLPSRMVDAHYALQRGPFRPRQIPSLKTPGWTILVQQTNTVLPSADRFLDCFRFVPEGRLDDLMISVASDQGGIGAHVDSYDVFLIQAQGFRRWEIAKTFDSRLAPGLDLKILQRFAPEQTMVCLPTRREIAQEVVVALSAPHPSVYYDTAPPLSARRFLRLLQSSEGLRLSPGSRLLLWHDFMAINGESVALPTTTKRTQQQIRQSLRDLANQRELSATRLKQRAHDDPLMVLLWQWFLQGYLVLIGTHGTGKRHPVKA